MINLNSKKAAMFGLDARIALAIFGALSIISGASLYSAIQNSKATQLLANLNELGKAWEQMYIDTGYYPDVFDSNPSFSLHYEFRSDGLLSDDSRFGWNGPYINNMTISGARSSHPIYGQAIFGSYEVDDNWYEKTSTDARCDTAGEKCAIWVGFDGIDSADLLINLDVLVDGYGISQGRKKGSIRYQVNTSTPYRATVLFKYIPIKNPN